MPRPARGAPDERAKIIAELMDYLAALKGSATILITRADGPPAPFHWPAQAETSSRFAGLAGVKRDIIDALRDSDPDRLTLAKLMAALRARGLPHSERTVTRHLGELQTDLELVNNDARADPPGYGLSSVTEGQGT